MTGRLEASDLSLVYDTARGFIGLKNAEEALRHALLSLMGSCGARSAAYLERMPDDRLVLRMARGDAPGAGFSLRFTPAMERAVLCESGPTRAADTPWLDSRGRSMLARQAIELLAPVVRQRRVGGLLALGPKLLGDPFTEPDARVISEIAAMLGSAVLPDDAEGAARPGARGASRGAKALRERHRPLQTIQGDGRSTRALLEEIVALAEFDLPVLLVGETGTGKELVARALHDLSPRALEPFEAINCAAIPPDLMPSALFGHERGAFTGAVSTARGAFERAAGGTLFLDEIGDMPFATQATLLRVLQERSFRRVGGECLIPARARIISATNHDLLAEVRADRFRADLFYRLQMYCIRILPLRDRRDEIPRLVEHLLALHAGGKAPVTVAPAFLGEVERRDLPGNVRELEGLILSALVRAGGKGPLLPAHLPPDSGRHGARSRSTAGSPRPLPPAERASGEAVLRYDEMEREYILSVLRLTEGNRKQAAALMGIPRTTLNTRMKKLSIC